MPVLASAGIGEVAALLTLFLAVSGVVGFVFMPDTSGKSLEQINASAPENDKSSCNGRFAY